MVIILDYLFNYIRCRIWRIMNLFVSRSFAEAELINTLEESSIIWEERSTELAKINFQFKET